MLHSNPSHQFTKSLRDLLRKIPGLIFGAGGPGDYAPPVPLVIRVGAAGPLQLGGEGRMSAAISAILTALKKYADSANPRFHERMNHSAALLDPQLRLICQLASGFDQMAASLARQTGYRLHVVLPGGSAAFRNDIERNLRRSNLPPSALSKFDELIAAAHRVLELDHDDESSDQSPFTFNDYAQAGRIILDHCDVVLVALHENEELPFRPGGARWIAERAEENDLTVIRVPVEQPFAALLTWTVDGRRERRDLFQDGKPEVDPDLFAGVLDNQLLGPRFDPSKAQLGALERRMIAQLDRQYNEQQWDTRWKLPSSSCALVRRDLGKAPEQIDRDLKAAKVWADHHASAMAELVRGSFILSASLGVVAVTGALVRVLFQPLGEIGELIEVVCLAVILWIVRRSRRGEWRSQWLSARQLERFLDQAAWLLLLGRGRIYATPSHLTQFQTDDIAIWTNAYFRALIRNCSFPTAHFSRDYLATVPELALNNLVVGQISYFKEENGGGGEIPFQQKADEFLQRWARILVATALAVTVAYLLLTFTADVSLKAAHLLPASADLLVPLGDWALRLVSRLAMDRTVPVLAALATSAAAALSAMRYHGEYAQIAARYEGAYGELQAIRTRLSALLPDHHLGARRLRSAYLASIVERATEVLIQEVQGWRAILQKKEIEPT